MRSCKNGKLKNERKIDVGADVQDTEDCHATNGRSNKGTLLAWRWTCHLVSQIESQLRSSYTPKNQQGERDFEAIAKAGQQYAIPILDEFKPWLETELQGGRILPKILIRSAFNYTLNPLDALCRYTKRVICHSLTTQRNAW